MQKGEFQGMIGSEVSESDWEIIETIYNYHPAVPEVSGKEIIRRLHAIGGVHLLWEMKPAAVRMRDLENRRFELKAELGRVEDEIKGIRDCYPTEIRRPE